ncbi:NADH-quinone oxidoreductase subunit C [Streptomyces sp. NPDC088747]|uniref:NADH-quinone oxidoreductase subunit C n=1 Tax=Streptomyces sp. NPDC088747 TaxID=3365886 RepID=UPI00381AB08D
MTGWLPAPVEELFGPEATAEESYEVLTIDVPPTSWLAALETSREVLGCTYFDWLSAVDEPDTGFRVLAHVAALGPLRRLLVRTAVPHSAPVLPSAVAVYAGAGWHERETHEMFGVTFEGHPGLDHLLLPEGFEGHPLRKDFVLAARVAKAWPGAKEPGESEHGGPKRRQMLPPGVPDPNEWGPLKGQLPPAPARGAARAPGDRPVRRARTAGEGSVSQAGAAASPPETPSTPSAPGAPAAPSAPGAPKAASVASEAVIPEASAATGTSEAATAPAPAAPAPGPSARPPRRARSVSQGSASQRAETGEPAAPEAGPGPDPSPGSDAARPSDAPWHHARPAFDEPESPPKPDAAPEPENSPKPKADPSDSEPESGSESEPKAGTGSEPKSGSERGSEPKADDVSPTPEDPAGGPR